MRARWRSIDQDLACRFVLLAILGFPGWLAGVPAVAQAPTEGSDLRQEALRTMDRATAFFSQRVATHGGYVYHYDLELKRRWGEGVATQDQIWVQPPGTPSVGLAFVAAYDATGNQAYLEPIRQAAEALVYGQLRSGGWTNCIDFDPQGERVAQYRGQPQRGKNNSSLDDGQTEMAIRFLIHADRVLDYKNQPIHRSVQIGLDSLLAAQYSNGAFPQVWTGPVPSKPIHPAAYPEYDWRTDGRVKDYWNLYTLNDDVAVYVAQTLSDAYAVYDNPRYLQALRKLGDFLILAQMPQPQPAWAQQYTFDMHPAWARKFEPPAVAGYESQGVIGLLMDIYLATGDEKYLAPIPAALDYLQRSLLSDGQLARYYELRTNRPLYMQRQGDIYELTYDDSQLPDHYGWKGASRLEELAEEYRTVRDRLGKPSQPSDLKQLRVKVEEIISELDEQGRWVDVADGSRLVGQLKLPIGERYIASATFCSHMHVLASFIEATEPR